MTEKVPQRNWLGPAAVVVILVTAVFSAYQMGWLGGESVPYSANGGYAATPYNMVPEFHSNAPSNAQPIENFEDLMFQTIQGEQTNLQKYVGEKNVVLVITRGLTGTLANPMQPTGTGQICTYCATQTSRLAANYSEFAKRNAEVVVVFPVVQSAQMARIADFEREAKIAGERPQTDTLPFPLWLDVELKSVDALGIRKDLSKPATYILDPQGKVRYAYVGESLVDRPSAAVLLKQLDEINAGGE